jgi:hypothetical protein
VDTDELDELVHFIRLAHAELDRMASYLGDPGAHADGLRDVCRSIDFALQDALMRVPAELLADDEDAMTLQ